MLPYPSIGAALTRLEPWYPGQFGVPGSDVQAGLRRTSRAIELYVDAEHNNASDNNDGSSPDGPKATIGGAVSQLNAFQTALAEDLSGSIIHIAPGTYDESVVTQNYLLGPSYVTMRGSGASPYNVFWTSGAAASPCLDLRAVGWRVENLRFGAPTQEAAVQLRFGDTGANDLAIRTLIQNCYFDGQTTGRYGLETHGAYNVQVINCEFAFFNNAVGGGAIAIRSGTTPLAIPYRMDILHCTFRENNNHVYCGMNACIVHGCTFQAAGKEYSPTIILRTTDSGDDGNNNMVWGNFFPGDYAEPKYEAAATDEWQGNFASDTAEAEVGDNGITILPPVA